MFGDLVCRARNNSRAGLKVLGLAIYLKGWSLFLAPPFFVRFGSSASRRTRLRSKTRRFGGSPTAGKPIFVADQPQTIG